MLLQNEEFRRRMAFEYIYARYMEELIGISANPPSGQKRVALNTAGICGELASGVNFA